MAETKVKVSLEAVTAHLDAAMARAASHIDGVVGRVKTAAAASKDLPPGVTAFVSAWQGAVPVLNGVSTALMSIGAATMGAVVAGVKSATSWAHEIEEVGEVFGVTMGKAQAFSRVAMKFDIDPQSATMAVMAVNKSIRAATDTNDPAGAQKASVFKRLGLDPKELQAQGRDVIDNMGAVIEALNKMPNSQERLSVAADLGLSGRVLKMARMGDLAGQMEATAKGPTFIDDEQMKRLAEGEMAFKSLAATVKGTWRLAFAEAAPAVLEVTKALTALATKVAEFVKDHPRLTSALVQGTFYLGAMATAAGLLLRAITGVVGGVVKLVSMTSSVVRFFSAFKQITPPTIPVPPEAGPGSFGPASPMPFAPRLGPGSFAPSAPTIAPGFLGMNARAAASPFFAPLTASVGGAAVEGGAVLSAAAIAPLVVSVLGIAAVSAAAYSLTKQIIGWDKGSEKHALDPTNAFKGEGMMKATSRTNRDWNKLHPEEEAPTKRFFETFASYQRRVDAWAAKPTKAFDDLMKRDKGRVFADDPTAVAQAAQVAQQAAPIVVVTPGFTANPAAQNGFAFTRAEAPAAQGITERQDWRPAAQGITERQDWRPVAQGITERQDWRPVAQLVSRNGEGDRRTWKQLTDQQLAALYTIDAHLTEGQRQAANAEAQRRGMLSAALAGVAKPEATKEQRQAVARAVVNPSARATVAAGMVQRTDSMLASAALLRQFRDQQVGRREAVAAWVDQQRSAAGKGPWEVEPVRQLVGAPTVGQQAQSDAAYLVNTRGVSVLEAILRVMTQMSARNDTGPSPFRRLGPALQMGW